MPWGLAMAGVEIVSFLKRSISIPEGEGARVRRLFPTTKLRSIDPFILLDEFYAEQPAGFPDHPHRGFEVVTYVLEGSFIHRDSEGNKETVEEGGVQRITTGKGIVHSEMPGTKGMNHGLQLWVNLPQKLKNATPSYQNVPPSSIPIKREEGQTVRVIVGEGSPVLLQTPVVYLDITVEKTKISKQKINKGFNALVYTLEGVLELGDSKGSFSGLKVEPHQAAVLKGTEFAYTSDTAARFVVISGKPNGT